MRIPDSVITDHETGQRSVVLPESDDQRVLTAARRMADDGVANPILVGERESIEKTADAAGISLEGMPLTDPIEDENKNEYEDIYIASRRRATKATARRLLKRPLYYAAMMVGAGHADAVVAGASHSTRKVIEAGMLMVGLTPGVDIPSSFFLILIPGFRGQEWAPLIFADCAVNVEPDAAGLAAIATASAASAKRLLPEPPRIAMLSYLTEGSAQHENPSAIHHAIEKVREQDPTIAIDGELQADAALIDWIAEHKVKRHSDVAGRANVLVFPDLNAGNIGYKLVQHLGGAVALGPILQGFARPVVDLSRGASADDIFATTRLALALA